MGGDRKLGTEIQKVRDRDPERGRGIDSDGKISDLERLRPRGGGQRPKEKGEIHL